MRWLFRGKKGVATAELIVGALIVTAVAITAFSAIGGSILKLSGRDRLVIECQDPFYQEAHPAECANP